VEAERQLERRARASQERSPAGLVLEHACSNCCQVRSMVDTPFKPLEFDRYSSGT
jgi:hypothetical protein